MLETSHEMEKSAKELIAEGTTFFIAKDYKRAKKSYTNLKDWYPFSKYAILAELKIADVHYSLEEYDEAISAYKNFERMHPKNKAIPYLIYQIGLCWFDQMGTIDRDHTHAKNSLIQFRHLVDQFPESEYVSKAKKKLKVCIDSLSRHELYIANFYYKTKEYKAALKRYEYLVENYPESKVAREALNKIPVCRTLANKN